MTIARHLILLTAIATAVPAQSPASPDLAALRTCIESRAEAGRFSGAMLVAERGRIVWEAGYGFSDEGGRVPNTPDTRFNIASLGKMFTAVAIAQLAEQGRLGFQDPISRHLPGLAPEIGAITIEQLLTHRSGLRDYARIENRAAIQSARNAADLLGVALADGLAFVPGSDVAYSNSGYVVLGVIVERLSGKTYAEYVRDRIFTPARMTATSLDGAAPRATAMTRRSPGVEAASGPPRPAPLIGSPFGSPAGGATSTVRDLFRFAEALRNHRLVRSTTAERLWRAHVIPQTQRVPGERSSYGYGFNRTDVAGRRFVGHGGGSLGVNAQIEIDPEAHRVAVALSNYDPPVATEAVQSARATFLGRGSSAICPAA